MVPHVRMLRSAFNCFNISRAINSLPSSQFSAATLAQMLFQLCSTIKVTRFMSIFFMLHGEREQEKFVKFLRQCAKRAFRYNKSNFALSLHSRRSVFLGLFPLKFRLLAALHLESVDMAVQFHCFFFALSSLLELSTPSFFYILFSSSWRVSKKCFQTAWIWNIAEEECNFGGFQNNWNALSKIEWHLFRFSSFTFERWEGNSRFLCALWGWNQDYISYMLIWCNFHRWCVMMRL